MLSPELRERIEAAIAKLDYRPNQMARGLKRGRNRLIGMLLADLTNPYSVEVLQGVEAACHALGYMPLICHAANEIDMERRYLQLLTTYRVEGVIVNALGVKEELLQTFSRGGIPVVLVDRSVEGLVTDMVGLDNRGGRRARDAPSRRPGLRRDAVHRAAVQARQFAARARSGVS